MEHHSDASALVYCVYSGVDVDKCFMNPEHIIPLSLGGCNEFIIPVCKIKNGDANRLVDNPMKNDFIMKFQRMLRDYRGHRNDEPVIEIPKASVDDKPASVHWSRDEISIYDPINKVHLQDVEKFNVKINFNLRIHSKFIAKVALATGYFLFRDTFVNCADHDSLRKYAFAESTSYTNPNLVFFDRYSFPPLGNEIVLWDVHEDMAKHKGCSGVIWRYAADKVSANVVIGGVLIGGVHFSADVNEFMCKIGAQDEFGTVLWAEETKVTYTPYKTAFDELFATLRSQEEISSSIHNKTNCSFCKKQYSEVAGLFAGHLCSICDECVICNVEELSKDTIDGSLSQNQCSFCYEEASSENHVASGCPYSICQTCLSHFAKSIKYSNVEQD